MFDFFKRKKKSPMETPVTPGRVSFLYSERTSRQEYPTPQQQNEDSMMGSVLSGFAVIESMSDSSSSSDTSSSCDTSSSSCDSFGGFDGGSSGGGGSDSSW